MFIDKSLKEYVDRTASSDHVPGGGSVLGLVGSLGGALTSMVMNLTLGKKAYEELAKETKDEILEKAKEIEEIIKELNQIVDEDTKAFSGAIKAFKLPKKTEEEKQARSQAIQEGYKGALAVPLKCAEKCLRLLELQQIFAEHGDAGVITDVGIGNLLAYAGLEGSLINVKINLSNIKDQAYNEEIKAKTDDYLEKGRALRDKSLKVVYNRI